MLRFETTASFRRDYRRIRKRGWDVSLLGEVIDLLLSQKPLPPRLHDHPLSGDNAGYRECHIRPDWLIIYRIEHNRLILVGHRTGTHADLFDK